MGVIEKADYLSIATAFDAAPIPSHKTLGTTNPTFPRSRVGEMPPELRTKVQSLSLTQLEALGEALLDFSQPADLLNWLDEN
jgi:Domain of unknown function (DUF4351)